MMDFLPQKALHLKDALKKKRLQIEGEYLITEKLDGWYGYLDFHVETGFSPVYSGAGRAIPSLRYYKDILKHSETSFNNSKPFRLIFEIYEEDVPFHILNGRLNRRSEQAENAKLYLHDVITLQNKSAQGRFYDLLDIYPYFDDKYFKRVPLIDISSDRTVWENHFQKVVDSGGEGIIMKQANSIYHPGKRNNSLLKLKLETTVDVECISIKNTVGAKGEDALNLVCRRKNGILIIVVVPKHEDKFRFRKEPEQVIGKVVELRAMKELENGQLREPRFKCVRYDKTLKDID